MTKDIQKLNKQLLEAIDNLDLHAIKQALESGADINHYDKYGNTPLSNAIASIGFYAWDEKSIVPGEENYITRRRLAQEYLPIIDYMVTHGADVNAYNKNISDDFPLQKAYWAGVVPAVKYLLEKGANPNINVYEDDPNERPIRSSVLGCINDLLIEEYDEDKKEIERLVRAAGGHLYKWGYFPWTREFIGKCVLLMDPARIGDGIFADNERLDCGTAENVTVENADGKYTTISLSYISDLYQWHTDFKENLRNSCYDWSDWKQRGYKLALQVAKLLPDYVALFYLFNNDKIVEESEGELYICKDGGPYRIK